MTSRLILPPISATLVALGGVCALLVLCFRPVRALAQNGPSTQRISVTAEGTQANGESTFPAISGDGRFVAFTSSAQNLVAGDTNQVQDVFVKDRESGAIQCMSVSTNGAPTWGASYSPSISGDGQRVAFVSEGVDLVAGDSNQVSDVFVRDLAAHATVRASFPPSGHEANGPSSSPRISADGRFVAMVSHASNLVPEDTNNQPDVFVRDLQTGALERVSLGTGGQQADGPSDGPAISADGRFVAFSSQASTLIPDGGSGAESPVWQVYLRDRANGTTVRVSIAVGGVPVDGHCFSPALSADGRFVAFSSQARNLIGNDTNEATDVYVRDVQLATTVRASLGLSGQEANGDCSRPSISADGRFVVFESCAMNIVADSTPEGTSWAYLRDLSNTLTTRLAPPSSESTVAGGASSPAISGDGCWVSFSSGEATLVGGDSNALEDVFLRGPLH